MDQYFKEFNNVAGFDEVGRGSWAGSLVVAGVKVNKEDALVPGVRDSKKISPKNREEIYSLLIEAHQFVIYEASSTDVDSKGISTCLIDGINSLIKKLGADFNLIDGVFKKNSFSKNSRTIIKGDDLIYAISASSIIAKVTRDRKMTAISRIYSCYGFERNKGYGTKEHLKSIQINGLCVEHRRSFKPLVKFSERDL